MCRCCKWSSGLSSVSLFVFATVSDTKDDETRASISEAVREVPEAALVIEGDKDGKAETCEMTVEAGEQVVSTPQLGADSLFAMEEVGADAETVRPLDDSTGEGKSRGESEAKGDRRTFGSGGERGRPTAGKSRR